MTPATERVAQALAALPCAVAATADGCWSVALPGHAPLHVRIGEGAHWLCLLATPRAGDHLRHEPAAALLAHGAQLAGLAKIALGAGADVPHLRAELPLDTDGALAPGLGAAVAGIFDALGAEQPAARLARASAAACTEEVAGASDEALDAAVRAAGFAVLARRPEFVAVDLGLDDVAARARMATDRAALQVWAEIDTVPSPLPATCAQALARFLLEVAATVCMVRPFVAASSDGRTSTIGFEARLVAGPACPRELCHALAALAVAARMAGREAAVLARDEGVAATYLALREPASARERAPRSTETRSRDRDGEGEE